jgi:DNA-binding CsgD family transcriptional regulator
MSALPPATLSTVILQVYALSRAGDVALYQRRALELVGRHVVFDCAWWGRGTYRPGEHRVVCSYPYRLPADIGERLNLSDTNNVVARRVVAEPGKVHYFSSADLRSQPSTAALTDYMGIEQSLCIADFDAATGISGFVSLARRAPDPCFAAHELEWLELLAPHLAAGLDMALADELAAMRNPERSVLVATDPTGCLRAGERSAAEMLRTEWPGWTGPRLPAALVERIAARQGEFLGRHLQASIHWHGDHAFVSMRAREPRDLLTRRERDVANAFAAGQSYREVAHALGLAPATVRHHLRSAYAKLGVTDKAEFATRLGRG